jgi:hypothetical protein
MGRERRDSGFAAKHSCGIGDRRDLCCESLDSINMYVEASTELKQCVLDRIGTPNRQARPLAPRAALLAVLERLQPAQTMLRRQARSPAAAPHIRPRATYF